jgi:hypothetical protein
VRIFSLVAPALLACGLTSAALAQAAAPSPVGTWGFITTELSDTCTISGEMTITQTKPKMFSCTFKAVQSCRARLPRTINTDQTCVATQSGAEVSITSKVDKIVSVDPSSMMKGMDRRYAPDNFVVTINRRGDQMSGQFESMGTAPVKFRRHQDLTS